MSIGDFVLTGGEIPAIAVVDSVVRLLPGVLRPGVVENESFKIKNYELRITNKNIRVNPYKEYPQYTRPEIFEGHRVPEVLLSGNHEKIEKWRNETRV